MILKLLPLLVINLYPIILFHFFNYDIGSIIFIFFTETLILAPLSIRKILLSNQMWDKESAKINPHLQNISIKHTKFIYILLIFVFCFVTFGMYLIPWDGGSPFTIPSAKLNYEFLLIITVGLLIFRTLLTKIHKTSKTSQKPASVIFNRFMVGRIIPLFLGLFIMVIMDEYINLDISTRLLVFILFYTLDALAYKRELSWTPYRK